MTCKTFKSKMDGIEYTYTQLPARDSIILKLRIAKVFGEAVPKLLNALGENDQEQLRTMVEVINGLLVISNPEDITQLISDCISTVQIGVDQINIDEHFSGNLIGLYTLLYWTLKNEYGDFLGGMTGILGLSQKPTVKAVG